MLGKIEGRKRRGWQRMRWFDGITASMLLSMVCKESDVTEQLSWTEYKGFITVNLVAQLVKNTMQCRRLCFDPWVGKIPCRREWLLTPVFLPGKFYGQRSLVGYSPWGFEELDRTEWLTLSFSHLTCSACFLISFCAYTNIKNSISHK